MTNLILTTDSYKHSHFLQYPPEGPRDQRLCRGAAQ
jgi:nicotinic acid phosphoribosyltransferase